MMRKIAKQLHKWLPTLWLVGVDQGVEQSLVHKSLIFVKSSHEKLGNTNSR